MRGATDAHRRLDAAIASSESIARTYLGPGERPPDMSPVQTGPRGGHFYTGGRAAGGSTAQSSVKRWRRNIDAYVRSHGRRDMDRLARGVVELVAGKPTGPNALRRCGDCGGPRARRGVCRSESCPARAEWKFVGDLLRGIAEHPGDEMIGARGRSPAKSAQAGR